MHLSLHRFFILLTTLPIAALTGQTWAWTSVGPGMEYQEFHLADPNNLFVVRMDRANTECFVDSMLGGGRLGTSETIRSQASRYDDAISYWDQDWGQRNDVIVAINGDFLDTSNNTPATGQIMSGWYTKAITASGRRFYYKPERDLAIGYLAPAGNNVYFYGPGGSLPVEGVNVTRGADKLIVYTPQYYTNTKTDSTGTEVLVEMTRPAGIAPASQAPVGIIRQVRPNAGSTTIPFDHVVLSASGTRAASLLAKSVVGDRVGVSFNLSGTPMSGLNTYASIGGGEVFLGDGVVWGGQDVRHPRTAIAYNDQYLFFVVVDGRTSVSVGMTMTELGNFCKDYLDAIWGINQDGGGSSTMVVNGVVKNDPSDGHDRAVVNGMFMGITQPKTQSTTYNVGDVIKTTTANVNLRLGPGTNYTSITTLGNNTQGTVLDHHLRGIYAKGYYWWKCNFNGTVGWIAHSTIALVSAGNLPRFTQHPARQDICPGGTGAFSVTVSATGAANYQWQFNGGDLADGGHYAGTHTPTLAISGVTSSEAGSYRCVVTDNVGTTTSHSAPLRLRRPTTIVTQPQPTAQPFMPRGMDISFSLVATAEGTPTYRWQKDDVNLSDSAKYTGTATAMLTVHALDSHDEGAYRCAVTGLCSLEYSAAINLAVLSPDLDRDGDVDQSDYGKLQSCYSGPAIAQTDPACQGMNLDNSEENDVDAADLAIFLQCLGAAGVPYPPGC